MGWEEKKKKREADVFRAFSAWYPPRLAVLLYCFIVLICRVHIKKHNTHDRTRVFRPQKACVSAGSHGWKTSHQTRFINKMWLFLCPTPSPTTARPPLSALHECFLRKVRFQIRISTVSASSLSPKIGLLQRRNLSLVWRWRSEPNSHFSAA